MGGKDLAPRPLRSGHLHCRRRPRNAAAEERTKPHTQPRRATERPRICADQVREKNERGAYASGRISGAVA
jgi:hypothetical protein